MSPQPTNHILLITLSNIGDAVMTTPVIVALRQQYPDASIDIVTDARASELFEHMPGKGTVFLKDKQAGWRGTARLVKRLRRQRYDLVVDLRTDGLTLLLRARTRLTRRGCRTRDHHAVQRHFAVIAAYEGLRDIPATTLWLAQSEHNFATSRLSGLPGPHWLAIGPGARWAPKRRTGDGHETAPALPPAPSGIFQQMQPTYSSPLSRELRAKIPALLQKSGGVPAHSAVAAISKSPATCIHRCRLVLAQSRPKYRAR